MSNEIKLTPAQVKSRIKIGVAVFIVLLAIASFAILKQVHRETQAPKTADTPAALVPSSDSGKSAADLKKAAEEAEKAKLKVEKSQKLKDIATKFKGNIITVDGTIYNNVKVLDRTPEGVEVASANGSKFIKFQQLDQKTQKYFQYDPVEESEYIKEKTGVTTELKAIKKQPHTLGDPSQK